ncbi:uncharacterized protein C7orf57 homolog isoform X2 [Latimeria chalumnae]|uniref:uncharacterized protein C7orf57 homolog isoform X2 n=1 Tax=Latimeria chalumnae TaxID=7897 RepID=UPI0003C1A5A6|nr:PREDICTED: uncharacterized protein C7orf57-like isoform X2 [Latimeria chalumnae]|eukprot:XP_005998011.1 PREDICTED: uncharacterized protein C7orf57-like isoform X2 [Latimeria chalumnae]
MCLHRGHHWRINITVSMASTEENMDGDKISKHNTLATLSQQKKENGDSSSNVPLQQTSQIPGLGDFSSPTDQDRYGRNRKWIRDTDSDYVKLAKQGGQPRLLEFNENLLQSTSPVYYKKPDWFSYDSSSQEPKMNSQWKMPDYMVHKEFKKNTNGNYEPPNAPFGTDSSTPQEKEKEALTTDRSMLRIPSFGRRKQRDMSNSPTMQMVPKTLPTQEGKVLQPVSTRRREEPVNMHKLLSFGYAEEWHSQRNDQERKQENLKTETDSLCNQEEVLSVEMQPNRSLTRKAGRRGKGLNKNQAERSLMITQTQKNTYSQKLP